MAFLINAYNAFTVELVLTRYPDLKSIKDLGSLLRSPWKKQVLHACSASERILDEIEHEHAARAGRLRRSAHPRGTWSARRSAARCCATKPSSPSGSTRSSTTRCDASCPTAAATATSADSGTLEVSKIFDWYRERLRATRPPRHRVAAALFARHADALGRRRAGRERECAPAATSWPILDYDWALNDALRPRTAMNACAVHRRAGARRSRGASPRALRRAGSRLRERGVRGRRRRRRQQPTPPLALAAPLRRSRCRRAARARRADERRRGSARGRRAAVPARRHRAARRRRRGWCAAALASGARVGPLRRAHRQRRAGCCAWSRR